MQSQIRSMVQSQNLNPFRVPSVPELVIMPRENMYQYEDLNYNSDVISQMVSYFRRKTVSWLRSDFAELLDYFIVKKDAKGQQYVDFAEKGKKKELSDEDKKLIMEHLEKLFITKQTIAHILHKYVTKKYRNWYDLAKLHKNSVKKYIKKVLIHKIEKLIEEKQK